MSKSRTKSNSPSTGGSPSPMRPWLRYEIPFLVFGALMLITIAILTPILSIAIGIKSAMLYSVANNGKFSGRADGNVYMRNGRIRAFRVPALVRNAYTTAIRSSFSTFSSGFRALTATEQLQWNSITFATKSNRFAQSYLVSGKAAYVAANQNLTDIGQTPITSPLAPVGALDETINTLVAANGANSVTFDATNLDGNCEYLVFATAGLSSGVSRPGASKFRIIGVQPAPVATVVTVSALYNAKFSHVPAIGTKIFLYTVPVNKTTGEKGAGSAIISHLITA